MNTTLDVPEGVALYGHGSAWRGVADAHDVDILVVHDGRGIEHGDAVKIARRARRGAALPNHLPLDVSVVAVGDATVWGRAILSEAVLLGGTDLRHLLDPLELDEWHRTLQLFAMTLWAHAPADAVNAALRALWAAEGRIVVAKSAVHEEARGGRWESIAAQAWDHRRDSSDLFEHPELETLVAEAVRGFAGDAWESALADPEVASRENGAALFTVYRSAGSVAALPDTPDRIAAVDGDPHPVAGGGSKVYADGLDEWAVRVIGAANDAWWGHILEQIEPPAVHRYPEGSSFPLHCDRVAVGLAPARSFSHRALNVVAMLQPADRGGQLRIHVGGHTYDPELSPGDVVVFDASLPHEVTPILAGERITLVTHALTATL